MTQYVAKHSNQHKV